jgi:FHS family glucose/mannose:H+ symporter-like MFS transporter
MVSSPVQRRIEDAPESYGLDSSIGQLSIWAFFVSGILLSFLGAILPAWGYHLRERFSEVGDYFLSLNLGFLLSTVAAHYLLSRRSTKSKLVFANALACGGFLFLARFSPPMAVLWRFVGLFWVGASAGLLHAGMFQAVSPLYQRDRAATTNLAGITFGLGCVVTALLVWGTYYVYTVPSILILLALLPGFFAGFCAKSKLPPATAARSIPISQVWRAFKTPGMALFTLLLFFQSANEWSIAGWLALFLIRRLGISPETSLLLLALYWSVLLLGRIASQLVMKRLSHTVLLVSSVASALLGTVVLEWTGNQFGAVMGILFIGAGFASIYPLVAARIGHRFPDYHPGLYNGLFSLALGGGLLAPWMLGYFVESWGIRAVMLLPMLGTCMVFVVLLLILLEAKLAGFERARGAEL